MKMRSINRHGVFSAARQAAIATALMAASALAQDHDERGAAAHVSAAQIEHGGVVYGAKCANCHGAALEGKSSVPLTGPRYMSKWVFENAKDLYDRVRTMPYGGAGTLSDQEYLDLTAFILARNGALVGESQLKADGGLLRRTLAVVIPAGMGASAAAAAGQTTTMRSIKNIIGQGPTQEELSAANGKTSDWLFTNHDYQGQRFVDLKQITVANVAKLRPACLYQVGDTNPFPTNPLIYKGQMFITSRNATVSLDAATCKVNWRYDRRSRVAASYGIKQNRGAALKDGKLILGTHDGFLIALDAGTGAEAWVRDISGDPENGGGGIAMAPMIFGDLVIMAPTGSELGVKGWIGAFKLSTGEPVWRFNTVPGDNEPGADSWPNHEARQHGGGAVWGSLTLDVSKNLLYVPVSNPTPDFDGGARLGDNLYTCSIVVLDIRTGKLVWYYQVTPHDTHDYDLTQASPMFSAAVGGKLRNLIVAAGKDGNIHVLDRDTREHLYEVAVTTRENVDKPWIQIDKTADGSRVCPGAIGGVQWSGPAYNPINNMLYADAADYCAMTQDPMSKSRGWLTAVDAASGKVAWRYSAERPMVGAVTTTSADLVFGGELTGDLMAFDARDGTVLYRFDVGGPITGGIATYLVGNKQYVAVASGAANNFWKAVPGSSTIVVFDLP